MRKAANASRRRRNRQGCVTGVFKFIIFIAVIIGLGFYLTRIYLESDLAVRIQKTMYPIKYEYFVEEYAHKYGVDKYLVYSVIRTESRFDRYAVSSAGAKGLMQLTDETGEHCAKKIKIDNYTNDALFDPETNIKLGCYYLSVLIDKYDDTDTAVAAYNGGPGNVDGWLKDKNCTDEAGKLVNIPFKETRNYVVRVKEAQNMYKSIYANIE